MGQGRAADERPDKADQAPRREPEEVREADPDGRIVRYRTVDSLGKLLRSGAITETMHDAGRAFQRDFQCAGLDPIRARPMMLPLCGGGTPELTESQLDARRRVQEALKALGGIGSPGGSCLWHVLGCGCSIREWAIRCRFRSKPATYSELMSAIVPI